MSQEVEKNLLYSGLLISLGVGGLLGFWWAVLIAGVLLFGVTCYVMRSLMIGQSEPANYELGIKNYELKSGGGRG